MKAERVKSWWQIRRAARELMELCNAGGFPGRWPTAASLSHAQVSERPLSFFVVNDRLAEKFGGHHVIINARVVSGSNPVHSKEACMSFPHEKERKVSRYHEVTISFMVPRWHGGLRVERLDLEGFPAFMAQHEIDHADGVDIYG